MSKYIKKEVSYMKIMGVYSSRHIGLFKKDDPHTTNNSFPLILLNSTVRACIKQRGVTFVKLVRACET
jgi:hypothetical protein